MEASSYPSVLQVEKQFFSTVGSEVIAEWLKQTGSAGALTLTGDEMESLSSSYLSLETTNIRPDALEEFLQSLSSRETRENIVVYGYESTKVGTQSIFPPPGRAKYVKSLALTGPAGRYPTTFMLPSTLERLVLEGDFVYRVQPPPKSGKKLRFACFQTTCNDLLVVSEQWDRFQQILASYESVSVVRLTIPSACLTPFRSSNSPLPFHVSGVHVFEVFTTSFRDLENIRPLFIDCSGSYDLLVLNTFSCHVPIQLTSILSHPERMLFWVPPNEMNFRFISDIPRVLQTGSTTTTPSNFTNDQTLSWNQLLFSRTFRFIHGRTLRNGRTWRTEKWS